MSHEEVWEIYPDKVRIRNFYFEEISLHFFTGFTSKQGILVQHDVKRFVGKGMT